MALDVLVSGGVDAVRISDLARRLNISKSGFYWHFRDRADLLNSMKSFWVEDFSQQIISETLEQDRPLRDRLLNVVQEIRKKRSGDLDLAFTSWGRNDPEVASLVGRVTEMRIAFIRNLLAETDCTDTELNARAQLFVVYFSWSEVTFAPTENGLLGEELNEILDIVTGSQGV